MKLTETKLAGSYVIELEKMTDERGFFARSWCSHEMKQHGLKGNIAQINTSRSKNKGTLRGLHYQLAPYQECKLIRCTKGAIFDFVADLRPNSPTFLQWFGTELTEDNHKSLYSPEGFAQGFITLVDNTEITYLSSQSYAPGYDRGVRWDDPQIQIELPINIVAISDKDKNWPDFTTIILNEDKREK
jgi:dTDP-4-dehydrorhamnose 3,5-epimerase